MPLTQEAHQQAKRNAALQKDPERVPFTYLNTLAVYALHSYLAMVGVESCLETSDGWFQEWPSPLLYSELDIPGLGGLVCCPIPPDHEGDEIDLSMELSSESFAYVAIRFPEALDQAEIIGYRSMVHPEAPPEILRITDILGASDLDDGLSLLSIEGFLAYLFEQLDWVAYWESQTEDEEIETVRQQLEQHSSFAQLSQALAHYQGRETKEALTKRLNGLIHGTAAPSEGLALMGPADLDMDDVATPEESTGIDDSISLGIIDRFKSFRDQGPEAA